MLLEPRRQVGAFAVRFGNVAQGARFAGVVDRDEVRVLERRGRPRLAQEPLPESGRHQAVGPRQLERDRPAQERVEREEDDPVPSLPQQSLDLEPR